MANEVKNDMAFINALGAIGNASYLAGYITDADDARKFYDAVRSLEQKLSVKHNFASTRQTEVGKALKA